MPNWKNFKCGKITKFWGSNGGSLEGTFVYANRRDGGRRTVIYGRDSAKVLMWKIPPESN